jgi:hypothetical protein
MESSLACVLRRVSYARSTSIGALKKESHTVAATYNGSTNFANSTSAAVTQVVQ